MDEFAHDKIGDAPGAHALRRLHMAVIGLGKVVDGKTLYEHNPAHNRDCFDAWMELNEAQATAASFLNLPRPTLHLVK